MYLFYSSLSTKVINFCFVSCDYDYLSATSTFCQKRKKNLLKREHLLMHVYIILIPFAKGGIKGRTNQDDQGIKLSKGDHMVVKLVT